MLDQAKLQFYDAVMLITDHDIFDYEMIAANAKLIIDCRGKYSRSLSNVVRA